MIRRVRQAVRRINYLSARRSDTIWSKAHGWVMVICLLLAFPAVFVADHVVWTSESIRFVTGEFFATTSAAGLESVTHATRADDSGRRSVQVDAPQIGRWRAALVRVSHGFPLATRETRRLQIDVDVFIEPDPRENVTLPKNVADLVASALDGDGEYELASLVRNGQQTFAHGWAWFGNALIWLVALLLAMSAFVLAARAFTHVFRVRRAVRSFYYRVEGRCAQCGYDLKGLEFSARCPECGHLTT